MKNLLPGSLVSIQAGFLEHPGIYTGQDTVIACSFKSGKVVEIPVKDFACGQELKHLGYPGQRPPGEVIAAARAALGRPWNLLTNNCEHFVARVHGLPPRSRQLEAAFVIGLAFLAGRILSRGNA